jgi:hypothetical protein
MTDVKFRMIEMIEIFGMLGRGFIADIGCWMLVENAIWVVLWNWTSREKIPIVKINLLDTPVLKCIRSGLGVLFRLWS